MGVLTLRIGPGHSKAVIHAGVLVVQRMVTRGLPLLIRGDAAFQANGMPLTLPRTILPGRRFPVTCDGDMLVIEPHGQSPEPGVPLSHRVTFSGPHSFGIGRVGGKRRKAS
jgi:hypothetical protein